MKNKFARLCTLASSFLLTIAVGANSLLLGQNPVMVFVVDGPDAPGEETNLDPLAIFEKGKFKASYPEENEAGQKKFADEYFLAGKKYRLTFGGGEIGTATVKSFGTGCNNIHAKVVVDDNGKLPGHLSGLATNSSSIGRKPTSRRAPTTDERVAVTKLVNQIYTSRRTSPSLLRLIKTTNLTATDLNGDGKFELIGSFFTETKTKLRRDLLLIVEPQGSGYKSAFVNFQSYKLPPEEFDAAIDFVDQLDIDGDGVGEVIALQHGFDAYGYNIYKKVNGRWREVLRTIGDAC